ncbi:MAG TPA: hypothetical protein VFU60_13210 [Ktedonobacterales bacterium]|nr:hypothetical protein [Ktedonobacterales bacterium]
MRRLEEIFWPTKWQAFRRVLGWTAFALAVPIACSAMGDQSAWGFFWLLIPPAIYCALIFAYKFSRDQKRASENIQQRYVQAEHYTAPAPKTTPGNRLFIPGDASNPPESL